MSQTLHVLLEQVGPSTSKGTVRSHTVLVDRPTAKGGADRGPLGGEYFLLALGGCFMSNLLAVIRSREAPITDVQIAVTGTIDGTPDHFTAITLSIAATHHDPELLQKLVTVSERACIVTNTLRDAVPISFVLREAPAGQTSAGS